jgi:hypothetical protein
MVATAVLVEVREDVVTPASMRDSTMTLGTMKTVSRQ